MPKVIYHHEDGATETVAADAGSNVMRAAVQNGVAGIVGECGGQAMCATCHVYVREAHLDSLPEIGEDEEEMLDCTAAPRDERRSRLGCQLTLGGDLEEVEVDVPATQI
ncbi:2Fe-2S iron-sulfur cluster binding domain-containing protein [Pseudonocardia sp. DSM 110487]|uniref:2Fe-2S iron-sulfur cluster-binding protein n=1 Tax=Pseudonocardia sp. DSM 110487 TaxID=2865833 RepID=UPI001C6A6C9B|nr:2Fe-2S iron-sulfur cluster-binding protein [Pseudonocardia sp. DSM 110487]QYN39070.1 2Fe-2S iron-sulfur cluster binding domain-containing protein [Pseudonocardia sp. DSM 110487]